MNTKTLNTNTLTNAIDCIVTSRKETRLQDGIPFLKQAEEALVKELNGIDIPDLLLEVCGVFGYNRYRFSEKVILIKGEEEKQFYTVSGLTDFVKTLLVV